MTAGDFVSLVLAALTAVFVLAPLFRRESAQAERADAERSELRDLRSRRDMALAALKDLEDDRMTGKIGDEDYADLKAKLSARAVELLKRLDEVESPGAATPEAGNG